MGLCGDARHNHLLCYADGYVLCSNICEDSSLQATNFTEFIVFKGNYLIDLKISSGLFPPGIEMCSPLAKE